jgi:hypothetical protein
VTAAATVSEHRDRAEQTAKDSPWMPRLARLGLVTRGALHLVVGWLAVRIAQGEPGRRADQQGALATLVRQPLGRFLVFALAVGFLAYAAWRFVEAALDPENKGPIKRIGQALRGVFYVFLFGSALRMVVGGASAASSSASGGGSETQDITAKALGWPGGRALVVAGGVVLLAMGVWNGWRGVTQKFEKDLKCYEMSDSQRTWTSRLGSFGHLARMVAYFVCSFFLVRAAMRFEPHEGVGLDASLHELAGRPYGPGVLLVVGVGLAAFGLYQFVLARYREILGD